MNNQQLRALYDTTLNKILSTTDNLHDFLVQNSRFLDYSFTDIVTIYGQNPHASILKTFQEWKDEGSCLLKGEKAIQVLNDFNNRLSRRTSYFDITQLVHKPAVIPETELSPNDLRAFLLRQEWAYNPQITDLDNYTKYLSELSSDTLTHFSHLNEPEKLIVPEIAEFNLMVRFNLFSDDELHAQSAKIYGLLTRPEIRPDRTLLIANNLANRQVELFNSDYSLKAETATSSNVANATNEESENLSSGIAEEITEIPYLENATSSNVALNSEIEESQPEDKAEEFLEFVRSSLNLDSEIFNVISDYFRGILLVK
ncbi:MAG: hypothetical protein LBV19_05325, partial [Streptococcaceae bacterium]|nr:hypothetical protein [Streptococcaceae bacterium]